MSLASPRDGQYLRISCIYICWYRLLAIVMPPSLPPPIYLPTHTHTQRVGNNYWLVDEWRSNNQVCRVPLLSAQVAAAAVTSSETSAAAAAAVPDEDVCRGGAAAGTGVLSAQLHDMFEPSGNRVGAVHVWKAKSDGDSLYITVTLDPILRPALSPRGMQPLVEWAGPSSALITPEEAADFSSLAIGVVSSPLQQADDGDGSSGSSNILPDSVPYAYFDTLPLAGRYTCATVRIALSAVCNPATSYYNPAVKVRGQDST